MNFVKAIPSNKGGGECKVYYNLPPGPGPFTRTVVTVGSHLVMNGADLATAKELPGHRNIQTTLRYAHLAQDHKREAIGRIGKLVALDTYMDTKPPEKEEGVKAITLTP